MTTDTEQASTASGRPTTKLLTRPGAGDRRLMLRTGGSEWVVSCARPTVAIGRAKQSEIRIIDDLVSREHGRIELRDGAFVLSDTSSNGTIVTTGSGSVCVHRDEHVLIGPGTIVLGHPDGPRIVFVMEEYSATRATWEPVREQTADESPTVEVDSTVSLFRREGDYWTVWYEGRVLRLKDTKGLCLIAHLLKHPSQEFHALDLAQALSDAERPPAEARTVRPFLSDGHVSDEGGAGPALDAAAKADYKQRIRDLGEELAEAESFNDVGRASKLQEEIEILTTQLAGAFGLGGRSRPVASNAERARVMIRHRIRESLEKISRGHPSLGAHLARSIKTGLFCSYSPRDTKQPVSWSF